MGYDFAGISSTTDDRLYAHEAAGLLLGGEDLPEAQQLAYLSALMQPLLSQIERNLPAITSSAQNGAQHGDKQLAAGLVLQVWINPKLSTPKPSATAFSDDRNCLRNRF